ncbi:hypothetical protein AVEN_15636-1, partial [Araneus ventricosus]
MMQHHAPTVTSNIYLHMLQLYAVPPFPEGVIFQQDGAPPHYGNIVRQFLNTTFPQRWIGRDAVMAWPPQSPDRTPLDFYLCGYVKQHVYSERINVIILWKQRITDVVHSVTPDVLKRVWEELDYRLDVYSATNGAPALNRYIASTFFSRGESLSGDAETLHRVRGDCLTNIFRPRVGQVHSYNLCRESNKKGSCGKSHKRIEIHRERLVGLHTYGAIASVTFFGRGESLSEMRNSPQGARGDCLAVLNIFRPRVGQ